MPSTSAPAELLDHLVRTRGLPRPEALRIVEEVVSFYGETAEAFITRRHRELQAEGLYRLAKAIGVPPRRINEIVHGRRSITPDSAVRIGQALGMTPEFWINLQGLYDLDIVRVSIDVGAIEPLVVA